MSNKCTKSYVTFRLSIQQKISTKFDPNRLWHIWFSTASLHSKLYIVNYTYEGLGFKPKILLILFYFMMDIVTQSTKILENKLFPTEEGSLNFTTYNSYNGNTRAQSILLIRSTTASIGIVANLTVIVVFLNHKKLKRKIPNIFIINQVRHKNGTLFITVIKICN